MSDDLRETTEYALPKDLTFEQALTRLEEVVGALERGSLSLDDSLTAFREGNALARFCQQRLTEVDRAISKLVQDGPDSYHVESMEITDEQ